MKATVWHKLQAKLRTILPKPLAECFRRVGTAFVVPFRFAILKGHARSSLFGRAQELNGSPIPWFTYPAIDFLKVRDYSNKTILEFGGGQSTLWWQKRAKRVLTIEENLEWAEWIKRNNTENAKTIFVPVDIKGRSIQNVIEAISTSGINKFDIIVIDGHLRDEIAKVADMYLENDGAIIMDNSEGYGFLKQHPTKKISCG